MIEFNNRIFHLWAASPSLNRMLLRSPKNESLGYEKNIDILFWGVRYVAFPFLLRGLIIREATQPEADEVINRSGQRPDSENIFVIISQGYIYNVIAVNYSVFENNLDIFDIGNILS